MPFTKLFFSPKSFITIISHEFMVFTTMVIHLLSTRLCPRYIHRSHHAGVSDSLIKNISTSVIVEFRAFTAFCKHWVNWRRFFCFVYLKNTTKYESNQKKVESSVNETICFQKYIEKKYMKCNWFHWKGWTKRFWLSISSNSSSWERGNSRIQ